jgi:hypothetical protein
MNIRKTQNENTSNYYIQQKKWCKTTIKNKRGFNYKVLENKVTTFVK